MILLRMIRNLIVLFQEKKDTKSQKSFERFQSALLGRVHEETVDEPEDIF